MMYNTTYIDISITISTIQLYTGSLSGSTVHPSTLLSYFHFSILLSMIYLLFHRSFGCVSSPGTGRTGTVLAIDVCLRQLDFTRAIDIPRCIYRLRQDRSGCVQTAEQYAFIYKVKKL